VENTPNPAHLIGSTISPKQEGDYFWAAPRMACFESLAQFWNRLCLQAANQILSLANILAIWGVSPLADRFHVARGAPPPQLRETMSHTVSVCVTVAEEEHRLRIEQHLSPGNVCFHDKAS
jgi:hypothetical protein